MTLDELAEGMQVKEKGNALRSEPWALPRLVGGTWGGARKGEEEHLQQDNKEQLGQ